MDTFNSFCTSMSAFLDDDDDSPIMINYKVLTQDMICLLLGYESNFVKKDSDGISWILSPDAQKKLTIKQKKIVSIFMGTSLLYSQVKEYHEKHKNDEAMIQSALSSAIDSAFSIYYKNISSYLPADDDKEILYILYFIDMHEEQFKFLIPLTALCYQQKGCKLISIIYSYIQKNKICAEYFHINVFDKVCMPMNVILKKWLLDGELYDPYEEFFIGFNIDSDNFWNKYFIRKTMVPRFISKKLSKKILTIGRYRIFLRQVCGDNNEIPGDLLLQDLFQHTDLEKLFNPRNMKEFYIILGKVYNYATITMLYIVSRKYNLFKHINALRNYMLMGNGEFCTKWLYPVYSTDQAINRLVLQTALEDGMSLMIDNRYEEDVFNRLNVTKIILDFSGKKIWEIYTLSYKIDGPAGFILNYTMPTYKALCGVLWGAKNMQYSVYNMWRDQILFTQRSPIAKYFHYITRQISAVLTIMIHFINQILLHLMCEVLDRYWVRMIKTIDNAQSVNDVLAAHTTFLRYLVRDFFLTTDYEEIMLALIEIYERQEEFEIYFKLVYEIFGELQECYPKTNRQDNFKLILRDVHSTLEPVERSINLIKSKFKISVKKFCSLFAEKSEPLVNFDYYFL
ncbi:gamma-tubulin complex component 3 homolog [Aethina tumida]|uniref:gamma-tubulin complex component 3 homolog n=1 Tax=Aethina tumida TaxID=116153 RepID=UPI0021486728|nr:gamma-tubulin complex component 3 homolog [Aethina tumida]